MTNTEWFEAAKSGNLKKLKEIIENGININEKDKDQNTALIIASKEGQLGVINFLLGIDNTKVIDLVSEWKNSDHNLSKKYVRQWKGCWKTIDINARNYVGDTALICAIRGKFYEVVKVLIDSGADVNIRNNNDETPLIISVQCGYTDIAKWLIDAKADVNAISKYKRIEEGYYRNYITSGGKSALIYAVENGHTNITKWLIDAKADVNIMDANGNTPLKIATEYKYFNIVKWLVDAGADIYATNNSGCTAFSIAKNYGYKPILYLFEKFKVKN